MADLNLEGTGVASPTKEDKNAVHTKTKSESKTKPQEVTTSQGFMYQPGNYNEAMVRLTQAISLNLNYLIEMSKAMMPEEDREKFLKEQAERQKAMQEAERLNGGHK